MAVNYKDPLQVRAFKENMIAKGAPPQEVEAFIASKVKAVPSQTPTSDNLGIVGAITKPAERYGRMVGEAVVQGGRYIASPDYRNLRKKTDLTGDEAKRLEGYTAPAFLSEGDQGKFSDPNSAIVETAKRTAGGASYAIPASRGLATAGAASGGLSSFSEEDAGVVDVVGGTFLGGALGKAGDVAGAVLSKGGRSDVLTKTGKNLRDDVLNPKAKPGIFYAEEIEGLADTARQVGLKGSPQDQLKQLPTVFRNIDAQVKTSISGKPALSINKPLKHFRDTMKKTNYLDDKKTYNDAAKEFEKRLRLSGSGRDTTIEQLYSLKSELRGELNNVFTKISRGNALTPTEEVRYALYKSLKDTIDEYAPDVRQLNLIQHHLDLLAPGLVENAGKGASMGVFGTSVPLPAETINRGKDALGRGMMNAGEGTLPDVRQMVNPQTAGYVGTNILPKTMTEEGSAQGLPPVDQMQFDSPVVPEPTAAQPKVMSYEQYVAAITADPKNAAIYKAIYDEGKELGGGELSAEQQKTISKLSTAENLLDSYEQQLAGVGLADLGPVARVQGSFRSAAGAAGFDNKTAVFNTMRKGTVSMLAKSLGEVGTLSDQDKKAALELIPKVTDSSEEAAMKLQQLRMIINGAKESVAQP